jgi:hypothetical protein
MMYMKLRIHAIGTLRLLYTKIANVRIKLSWEQQSSNTLLL